MAIDSYAKLQSTVAWFGNRDDIFAAITNFSPAAIDSAAQIAIAFAEGILDTDINSRGGTKYAETVNNSLVTTGGTETVTLPSDFQQVVSFALTTDPYQVLKVKTPDDLFGTYPSVSATGKPEAYTIIGQNTAYLRYVPDNSYTLRLIYMAKLTPLSNTNTSNWLLANAPQLYTAAAMVQLCVMMENDDRLPTWQAAYTVALNNLMGTDRMTRWAGVNPTPQPVGLVA